MLNSKMVFNLDFKVIKTSSTLLVKSVQKNNVIFHLSVLSSKTGGLKWWMLEYEREYKMVYLYNNFVIMLVNNNLDHYYHLVMYFC